MKKFSRVLNGFGIFFAAVLSVILVVCFFSFNVFFAFKAFLTPASFTKAVTTINITSAAENNETIKSFIDASGNNEQAFEAILKTDAVNEILNTAFGNTFDALSGKTPDKTITTQDIKNIIEDNMPEMIKIRKQYISGEANLSDDEIKNKIYESSDMIADVVINLVPSGEALSNMLVQTNFVDVVPMVMDNMVVYIFIGLLLFVSVLIFVCRLKEFRGVRWLGVNYTIVGILTAILAVLTISASSSAQLFGKSLAFLSTSLINEFANNMLIIGIIIAVIPIGLIIASVFINKAYISKKITAQNITE